jgi:hypothetical protein
MECELGGSATENNSSRRGRVQTMFNQLTSTLEWVRQKNGKLRIVVEFTFL